MSWDEIALVGAVGTILGVSVLVLVGLLFIATGDMLNEAYGNFLKIIRDFFGR